MLLRLEIDTKQYILSIRKQTINVTRPAAKQHIMYKVKVGERLYLVRDKQRVITEVGKRFSALLQSALE